MLSSRPQWRVLKRVCALSSSYSGSELSTGRNTTLERTLQCALHAASVAKGRSAEMWNTVRDELREIALMASVIGGLSVAGVSLAIVLAAS